MKRLPLFEFLDLEWFPTYLRRCVAQYLATLFGVMRVYRPAIAIIRKAMRETGRRRITDLCSGSAGPWPDLWLPLARTGISFEVTLTDKYPAGLDQIRLPGEAMNHLAVSRQSVDATGSAAFDSGLATMFSSLHHFSPDKVKGIFQACAARRAGICVFEMTERSLAALAATLLLAIPMMLLITPLVKPFSLGRFFWTYVIPVLPVVYLWDGLASHLRSYTRRELQEIVSDVPEPGFEWHVGRMGLAQGALWPVHYVAGWPRQAQEIANSAVQESTVA